MARPPHTDDAARRRRQFYALVAPDADRGVPPPDPDACAARQGSLRCELDFGHPGDHRHSGTTWARPQPSLLDAATPWPDGGPGPLPAPDTDWGVFARRDLPRDRRMKALLSCLLTASTELRLLDEATDDGPRSLDLGDALIALRATLRAAQAAAGRVAHAEHMRALPVTVRGGL